MGGGGKRGKSGGCVSSVGTPGVLTSVPTHFFVSMSAIWPCRAATLQIIFERHPCYNSREHVCDGRAADRANIPELNAQRLEGCVRPQTTAERRAPTKGWFVVFSVSVWMCPRVRACFMCEV